MPSAMTPATAAELKKQYFEDGYVLFKRFFDPTVVQAVQQEAQWAFVQQLRHHGLLETDTPEQATFESALFDFFTTHPQAFLQTGKTVQHLVSLHRLSLDERIIAQLKAFGLAKPNVCTRPVMYFNHPRLAKSEGYYKTAPHQDWRSMQGSLNSMVVWLPLVDVSAALGPLDIVPKSHTWGLLASEKDDWYRHITDPIDESQYQSVPVEAGDAVFFSSFLVHRSGNHNSPHIRWSCHFRYNDLAEPTFIERGYPNPYRYQPEENLVTPDFPAQAQMERLFTP